ncbi:MAG: hypothetical protein KTR25_15745 [Myxococcales bacterium]|nr:hypothetical protein [Myxococcales bacterium]
MGGILEIMAVSACSSDESPPDEQINAPLSRLFSIELIFESDASDDIRDAFLEAKSRWETLIVADVADIVNVDESVCGATNDGIVDDITITVELRTFDGRGGTLGQAGPVCIRIDNGIDPRIPVTGRMEFDIADLQMLQESGMLNITILHEMGHALGIGTLWRRSGLLVNPSCSEDNSECDTSGTTDVRYIGQSGLDAWVDLGGDINGIPVENRQGPGSSDGHWREFLIDTGPSNELLDGPLALELMSPLLSRENALSVITLNSLIDLGYQVADRSAADPLTVIGSPLSLSNGEPTPILHMTNDILDGPIYEVSEDGHILGEH